MWARGELFFRSRRRRPRVKCTRRVVSCVPRLEVVAPDPDAPTIFSVFFFFSLPLARALALNSQTKPDRIDARRSEQAAPWMSRITWWKEAREDARPGSFVWTRGLFLSGSPLLANLTTPPVVGPSGYTAAVEPSIVRVRVEIFRSSMLSVVLLAFCTHDQPRAPYNPCGIAVPRQS